MKASTAKDKTYLKTTDISLHQQSAIIDPTYNISKSLFYTQQTHIQYNGTSFWQMTKLLPTSDSMTSLLHCYLWIPAWVYFWILISTTQVGDTQRKTYGKVQNGTTEAKPGTLKAPTG